MKLYFIFINGVGSTEISGIALDAEPVLEFLLHENNTTDNRQVDKINECFR